MKFYVASGIPNMERANEVAAVLIKNGHVRTYDWSKNGDVSKAPDAKKRAVAEAEARAVRQAEFVLILLPGRFGTHAELGMAIATRENKQILLWAETDAPFTGEGPFCVFYHHPAVERLSCSYEALLERIKAM